MAWAISKLFPKRQILLNVRACNQLLLDDKNFHQSLHCGEEASGSFLNGSGKAFIYSLQSRIVTEFKH